MKGELTPEEINMNSIGMFRAGVDTVNTPIITEFIIIITINIIISTFIIINLRIITKLLRPHPRVSTILDKTVEKIAYLGGIFSELRS